MLRLALLSAFCLSAPTIASAQGDVDPVVARMAETLRAGLRPAIEGLMRFTGVRGEGRTLIVDIELTAGAPPQLGPPQVASMFTTGICADAEAAAFFGGGRVLQVRVARAGRAAESVTVDRCPGPSGEGLTAAAFAAGLQAFVGQKQGGMTIAAVRADGDMMIVTLDFPPGESGGAAANSEGFVLGFCAHPEVRTAFFGPGLILRVDTTIGGGDPEPGPAITACPPR